MKKSQNVKEIYSETYQKNALPLDTELLKKCIEKGAISGYVQRNGKLSDGNSFNQIYIVIKEDVVIKEQIEF